MVTPVEWEGRVFEKALNCEEVLPEAFAAQEGLLPHLHSDPCHRFPRAVACEPSLDADPPSHDGLETRGRALGERVVRFKRDGELPHQQQGTTKTARGSTAETQGPTNRGSPQVRVRRQF